MRALWKFSFFLILGLTWGISAIAGPKGQVIAFLLKVQGENTSTSCTATLMKGEDSVCHLITNAHCFDSKVSSITIKSPKSNYDGPDKYYAILYPSASDRLNVKTQLLKVDPSVDLAELAIPNKLKKYCSRIGDLLTENFIEKQIQEGVETARYMSIGYHQELIRASYSRDAAWPDLNVSGYQWAPSNAPATYSRTSLPGLRYLYRLWYLQMVGGMSGGPTLDSGFRLIGINRRYIPFQEITEVIPLQDVLSFIKREGDQNILQEVLQGKNASVRDENHQIVNGGENSGANGGENSGANGGENSGANGGENSGANGGDTPQNEHSPLAFLREPIEGIIINGQRILAMGPYQIDGLDDYRRYAPQNLPIIHQNGPEFLSKRKDIINRLKGHWAANAWGFAIGREKILIKEKNDWVVASQHHTPDSTVQVTVHDQGFTINLEMGERFNIRGGMPYPADEFLRMPARRTYQGRISEDGSLIELHTSEGHVLKCHNTNYLKLICSSSNEEFSLSLSATSRGYLNFRHSVLLIDAEGKTQVTYRYGTLGNARPYN